MLEGLESELWLNNDITWSVKLVEKSGRQLKTLFSTRIPITRGFPLGTDCKVCDSEKINCTTRNVVYLAEYGDCKETGTVDGMTHETTPTVFPFLTFSRTPSG